MSPSSPSLDPQAHRSKFRIVLFEGIHPTARELLEQSDFEVESFPGSPSNDELKRLIASAHFVGIRSKTQLTENALAAAHHLLSVGCFCIGTNQVDLDAARLRGVPVFNAPFSNTRSVAELVMAEVVALARKLGDRTREMHEGVWKKTASGCLEVRGKTLGIVGYGHIGTQVGVLAEAFGLRVIFHDIVQKLPMGNARQTSSLTELLGASDFVTLHVPATEQTKLMIRAPELALMRPGAYLINASRGGVVDVTALAEAIRSKHLGGAAIDVFPKEPQSNDEPFASELRGLPNLILTPHIGGSTEEAQEAIGKEVATALNRFARLGSTASAVNFPQIDLQQTDGTHRIMNVHRNVPGVLSDINKIVSDVGANVRSQLLSTDADIGYLVMDLDRDVSQAVAEQIRALDTSIRTRIKR